MDAILTPKDPRDLVPFTGNWQDYQEDEDPESDEQGEESPEDSVDEDEDESEDDDDDDEDEEEEDDDKSNHENKSEDEPRDSYDTDEVSHTKDSFPHEEDLLYLTRIYDIRYRMAYNRDIIVYRATHIASGDEVVIKLNNEINVSLPDLPREIRFLGRLQGHPNIAKFIGYHMFEKNDMYAVILEYVPYCNYKKVLWSNPEKIQHFMRDGIAALQHCHDRGILYRDMKPSNLLWDDTRGKAILIDFDVCVHLNREDGHRSHTGTNGFRAPEMNKAALVPADDPPYSIPIDVFALGAVFATILFRLEETDIMDHGNVTPHTIYESVLKNRKFKQKLVAGEEKKFLLGLLEPNPDKRLTLEQASKHPFFVWNSLQEEDAEEKHKRPLAKRRGRPKKKNAGKAAPESTIELRKV